MAATFEVTRGKSDRPTALIASFTNGKLKENSGDSVTFSCYQCKDKDLKAKRKRILAAETDDMQYVGHSFGDRAPKASSLAKYMLVVHDPKTRKARVVDAELYQLQPSMKRNDEDSGDEDFTDMTFIQKSDMLTGAFGSSKKQRAMASRQKNLIKGEVLDTAVGSAINQALATPDANVTLTPVKKADAAAGIPPHNKDAKSPAEVYALRDIVSPAVVECLANPAQIFIDSTIELRREWREQETYPSFICHHVSILPVDVEARKTKSCYLMYLHYMIQMYKLTYKEFRRRDPLPEDWPEMVRKSLLKKFCLSSMLQSGRTAYALPSRMKDTLLSYILVLALILDQWKLDYTAVMKDLKLGQTRVANHFRALGCKVSVSKKKMEDKSTLVLHFAELVVPLTFPDQRERQKKDRR